MTIIAISRSVQFSPNHIGNDAAIYNKVIEELRSMGHSVCLYTEEEFMQVSLSDTSIMVVTMSRDIRTVNKLLDWEKRGVVIINSPRGILNCVRQTMTELLLQQNVPHPQSWILSTEDSLSADVFFPCWLKRGDSHAIVKGDVCYAASRDEAISLVNDMRQRGISTVVVNEHLQGDLVKFYGVQDDSFFYWFYPSSTSHSKFGLEEFNGKIQGFSFDSRLLKQYADKAARVLDVPIYGGDAVVAPDGNIRIIDFNDWPSFAPCRDEAARAIARRVIK